MLVAAGDPVVSRRFTSTGNFEDNGSPIMENAGAVPFRSEGIEKLTVRAGE